MSSWISPRFSARSSLGLKLPPPTSAMSTLNAAR
jgi:hypothetical protein